MIKIVIFIFFLILTWGSAKAQTDIPVDLHTGRPTIIIPLHQVRSGDLTVPISLSYNAGGVRVDGYSDPDYVGVNWQLNAGGSITRHVRALPDDYTTTNTADARRGWLFGMGAQAVKNFTPDPNCNNEGVSSGFFQTTVGYNQDTEPDVFSFQFGSFSGQFVFDNDKQVRVMPFQDFTVKINGGLENDGAITAEINNIEITTNDGVIYKFHPIEQEKKQITTSITDFENNVYYLKRDYNYYLQPITYNTKWGLSEIVSPTGGKVLFDYSIRTSATTSTPTNVYARIASNNSNFNTKSIYNTVSTITKSRLQAISASLWDRVQINYSSNTEPTTGISIYKDNHAPIKQYLFNYKNTISDQRNWLASVQASIDTYQKEPPYIFEYSGVNFANYSTLLPPAKTQSYAQDHWGYFNGNTGNTTLFPTIYVYADQAASERYRIQPIAGITPTHILPQGANRSVNPEAVVAGTLEKITYPTGGHTRLYYESNEYFDPVANQLFKGGGLRVKKIITHDGISYANDIVKEYLYDSQEAVLINRPQFVIPVTNYKQGTSPAENISSYTSSLSQQFELFTVRTSGDLNLYLFDNPNVIYRKVTEKQVGKGNSVYEYQLPTSNGATARYGSTQSTDSDGPSPYNWQATYTYLSRIPYMGSSCFLAGKLEGGYYVYPFPTSTNYAFERGLIKSIKNYNEAGQLLKERTYTYQRINKSTNPVLVYGVAFEAYRYDIPNYGPSPVFTYGKYKLLADVTKVTSEEKEVVFDPTQLARKTESAKASVYDSPNHRMLTRTTTTTTNDGINFTTYATRYKYPKDYTATSTSSTNETVKALEFLKASANSTVIEEISSIIKPGDAEKVTGARLTLPKRIPGIINTVNATDRVLPGEIWGVQTNIPIPLADFKGLEAVGTGSGQILRPDSRYQFLSRIEEYNRVGKAITAISKNKITQSVLWDETGERPLAAISNATASQVVYSGFDEKYYDDTSSPEWQPSYGFDNGTGYTLVPGRIGKAKSVPAGFTFQKNGLTKGIGTTYTFSCWIKSVNNGSLTVKLSNMSSPAVDVISSNPISFSNSGTWSYYEVKLPVTALQSSFAVRVSMNAAITIDDMLFYPSMASVLLSAYNLYGKIAETDTYGFTIFNTYDAFGRLTLVRDQDNNILKRQVYNYRESIPIYADILITSHAGMVDFTTGSSISFKTGRGDDPSGITRTWNFGDGTASVNGTTPSHSYTSAGVYTITLTASHAQYGSTTSKLTITVRQPTNFQLCVSGTMAYDFCYNGGYSFKNGTCTDNVPVGTNTFQAQIVSGCVVAGQTYQYKWEKALQSDPESWVVLPETTSKLTVTVQPSYQGKIMSSDSYIIRCTVTPSCLGTTVSNTEYITFMRNSCN